MMLSGDSERGLSEVTMALSASRAATAPISGRLPRSRSPPAPNTHMSRHRSGRRRRELARGLQDVLERVGRVGIVDEEAKA